MPLALSIEMVSLIMKIINDLSEEHGIQHNEALYNNT